MARPSKRDILRLRKEALDGMVSYMKFGGAESETDPDFNPDFEAGYTQTHVDRCAKILDGFLATLEDLPEGKPDASILKAVQGAVLELNQLNAQCGGALIETDQREQLCELILAAAQRAGLVSSKHDITEAWRTW